MLACNTDKHWKKGYVSGSFDMFHVGHLNLIRRSKERCDFLVIGVLEDEIINLFKGKYPVIPLEDRLEIIKALKYADEVDVTTPELINKIAAWEKYRFDAMFSGDDHINDGWAHEEEDLKKLGADLVFFPYTKKISSTMLRKWMISPDIKNIKVAREKESFEYLFPFDKIGKHERLIIYGTGIVGGQYARQLSKLNFFEIIAFADTSANSGDMFMGKMCMNPEELLANEESYDRIVIASVNYRSEILERLHALGIQPEKIV